MEQHYLTWLVSTSFVKGDWSTVLSQCFLFSFIHSIVNRIIKLGNTPSSFALAPALVETYSRLLVYMEIESLGIKGFISKTDHKQCYFPCNYVIFYVAILPFTLKTQLLLWQVYWLCIKKPNVSTWSWLQCWTKCKITPGPFVALNNLTQMLRG